VLFPDLMTREDDLPRQARDKREETSKTLSFRTVPACSPHFLALDQAVERRSEVPIHLYTSLYTLSIMYYVRANHTSCFKLPLMRPEPVLANDCLSSKNGTRIQSRRFSLAPLRAKGFAAEGVVTERVYLLRRILK
jgi:hypothetical protein